MRANKTASEGAVIADNVGGNVTIGLTFAEHQAALKEALKQKTKDLKKAHKADKALILQEMTSIQSRLANIESDYEKTKAELAEHKARLARYENQIDPARKQAAFDELDKGKLTLAKAIFEELAAQSRARALTLKLAKEDAESETAEFEFELGKIAEQDYHWKEAFTHFSEAAHLHPTYAHLIHAQKAALQIANYPEAESLAKAALKAADQEFGKTAPEYGTALNNLAGLLEATGRFEEAEPMYRQALENARVALGEDHPKFGIRLNNLAGLLEATGRFEEAEPLYRQALENARVALGEDHPEFGTRLNNLAALLEAKGRFDEAEPLYRQAVAVFEKSLGSDHPSTKTVKTNFERFLANRPTAD